MHTHIHTCSIWKTNKPQHLITPVAQYIPLYLSNEPVCPPPLPEHTRLLPPSSTQSGLVKTWHNYQAGLQENDKLWWPTSCQIQFLLCICQQSALQNHNEKTSQVGCYRHATGRNGNTSHWRKRIQANWHNFITILLVPDWMLFSTFLKRDCGHLPHSMLKIIKMQLSEYSLC